MTHTKAQNLYGLDSTAPPHQQPLDDADEAPRGRQQLVSAECLSVSDQYSDDTNHDKGPGPLNDGDRFLKFEIVREIGAGGYARVYHAYDTFFRRDVALKIIHRPKGNPHELYARTSAEARFLFEVKHPFLVDVYEGGYDERNVLYIAMELLRGRPLRSLLMSEGSLSWEYFLPIAAKIAEALQVVHDHRAIHRDIKPENVFILKDNSPKVLDFGISKFIDAPAIITRKNVYHGTPSYMAPEQLFGKPANPQTDMYALGMVCWETLAGKHPMYLEPCKSTEELLWRHTRFSPPLLSDFNPKVPRRIAKVINRMIAKAPEQRPNSMSDLAASLRRSHEKCSVDSPVSLTHSTADIHPPRQILEYEPPAARVKAPATPPKPRENGEKKNRKSLLPQTWIGAIALSFALGFIVFSITIGAFKLARLVSTSNPVPSATVRATETASPSVTPIPSVPPPATKATTSRPSSAQVQRPSKAATIPSRGPDKKRQTKPPIDTETPLIMD